MKKEQPKSEAYVRVRNYITSLHTSGHHELLKAKNKAEFIKTILDKKELKELDQAAIKEIIALDRYRRLVFQYNPELKVDDDATTHNQQQNARKSLGYTNVPIIDKDARERQIEANKRTLDMQAARKIMEKNMEDARQKVQSGEDPWKGARQVVPQEYVTINQELFNE